MALVNADVFGLTRGEYSHMRLDTYQPRTEKQAKALRTAQMRSAEWTTAERWEGLMFYSPTTSVGCGKTHLAIGMLWEAALTGKTVAIFQTSRLFADFQADFTARAGKIADLQRTWRTADVLLLDDLGTERQKGEWVPRLYFSILDERLMAHQTTIITTNLTMEQIEAYTDERCASRIGVLCGKILTLDGPDGRKGGK